MTDKEEPESIRHRDWRLQAITVTSAPVEFSGHVYEAGSKVEILGHTPFLGSIIKIRIPSPTALYLSQAGKMATQAEAFLGKFSSPAELITDDKMGIVREELEGEFFDCLECLVATVMLSFSAVEAFANQAIPDGYSFLTLRKDRRCSEVYDKQQAERHLKIETKLDEILPDVMKVQSPKGTKIWEEFVSLKRLRDRLVHLKSSDLQSSGPDGMQDFIWAMLISEKPGHHPTTARRLISAYYPQDRPRWLWKFLAGLAEQRSE